MDPNRNTIFRLRWSVRLFLLLLFSQWFIEGALCQTARDNNDDIDATGEPFVSCSETEMLLEIVIASDVVADDDVLNMFNDSSSMLIVNATGVPASTVYYETNLWTTMEPTRLAVTSPTTKSLDDGTKNHSTISYYGRCVPRSNCLVVFFHDEVEPSSNHQVVSILIDGSEDDSMITSKATYPYWGHATQTRLDIGNCVPSCQENETLLELEFFHGDISLIEWFIEDSSGNRLYSCDITDGLCPDEFRWNTQGISKIRTCIDNMAHDNDDHSFCYNLVIGDQFYDAWDDNYNEMQKSSFQFWLDGELVASKTGFRFESFPFGDACDKYQCDRKQEILLEVAIWRSLYSWDLPELSLTVQDHNGKISNTTMSTTTVNMHRAWPMTNSSVLYDKLLHYQACVPRYRCLDVSISVPDTYIMTSDWSNDTEYLEYVEWRVLLGESIVHDAESRFGREEDAEFFLTGNANYTFHHRLTIGDCSMEDVCNLGEFLFDIQLHALASSSLEEEQVEHNVVGHDQTVLGAKDNYFPLFWFVDYVSQQPVGKSYNDFGSSYSLFGGGYEAGRSYRAFQCIPLHPCTAFKSEVQQQSAVEYIVTINGKQELKPILGDDGYLAANMGGKNCQKEDTGLSKAALGGIIAASTVVFLGLVFWIGYKYYYHEKRARPSPNGTGNVSGEETPAPLPLAVKIDAPYVRKNDLDDKDLDETKIQDI